MRYTLLIITLIPFLNSCSQSNEGKQIPSNRVNQSSGTLVTEKLDTGLSPIPVSGSR